MPKFLAEVCPCCLALIVQSISKLQTKSKPIPIPTKDQFSKTKRQKSKTKKNPIYHYACDTTQ
jgi:hypothetical protein